MLAPGGRAVVATFDTSHFDGFWLNPFFPSLEAIDRARFPDPDALAGELEGGRFRLDADRPARATRELDRETALERIRGRHISTFDLVDEDEVAEGTARAERELPEHDRRAARVGGRGRRRSP